MRTHRAILAAVVLAACLGAASSAGAGSNSLPPDVDLDPDRGMTFGRLGRTRLPADAMAPFKQTMRSRVMDPAIDPFASMPTSGRYDPSTGRIQGGLTDTVKQMRKRQEASRSNRRSDR